MGKSDKKADAPKRENLDVQRKGESDWNYTARRREELSNDGAASTYEPGPVPNLVQQFRGKPDA